jgi:hypothetical protein
MPKNDAIDLTLSSEDDLFWFLGVGRFGQSEWECDIFPTLLRACPELLRAAVNIEIEKLKKERE